MFELVDLNVTVLDSRHFTPHGRKLLVALGVLDPDPLRVQAEEWLAGHTGCASPATRYVRAALGNPVPQQWVDQAEAMRTDSGWRGSLRDRKAAP